MTLDQAIYLALAAHHGQTDKSGVPYVLHSLTVMLSAQSLGETAMKAAVLHDVCEDTEVTLEGLKALGAEDGVLYLVDALTRREGETYPAFILRVKEAGKVAARLKELDVLHNVSRLPNLSIEEQGRLASRYDRALAVLGS